MTHNGHSNGNGNGAPILDKGRMGVGAVVALILATAGATWAVAGVYIDHKHTQKTMAERLDGLETAVHAVKSDVKREFEGMRQDIRALTKMRGWDVEVRMAR